jgi:uncharacterized protein (DUF983 family)
MEFFLIILWLVFCIVVASAAGKKGKSAGGYFFLSFLLSPLIGAIILALSGNDASAIDKREIQGGTSRKCPKCGEAVKLEASICKHCQNDLSEILDAEKAQIKELLLAQTPIVKLAKELGLSVVALDKRVQYHFNIKGTGIALSKVKKGEFEQVSEGNAAPVTADAENRELRSGAGRKCPRCGETVKLDALICKHCQKDLTETVADEKAKLKELLLAGTKTVDLAKEMGVTVSALDKRIQYHFDIKSTGIALALVKKGEFE